MRRKFNLLEWIHENGLAVEVHPSYTHPPLLVLTLTDREGHSASRGVWPNDPESLETVVHNLKYELRDQYLLERIKKGYEDGSQVDGGDAEPGNDV